MDVCDRLLGGPRIPLEAFCGACARLVDAQVNAHCLESPRLWPYCSALVEPGRVGRVSIESVGAVSIGFGVFRGSWLERYGKKSVGQQKNTIQMDSESQRIPLHASKP